LQPPLLLTSLQDKLAQKNRFNVLSTNLHKDRTPNCGLQLRHHAAAASGTRANPSSTALSCAQHDGTDAAAELRLAPLPV